MSRLRCIPFVLLLASFSQAQVLFQTLPFRPIAEKQSRQLDRLIFISANPDVLHIYEPGSGADTTVALPKPALCLDVSPDGKYAAVGHDGALSWVDLTSASIAGTFPVPVTVNSVILGANYAWINGLATLKLRSGQLDSTLPVFDLTSGVLSADGKSLYGSSTGSDDMLKYDVSSGTPAYVRPGLITATIPTAALIISPWTEREFISLAAPSCTPQTIHL